MTSGSDNSLTLPLYASDLDRAAPPPPAFRAMDRRLRRDLRTLALFISMFCRARHKARRRTAVVARNLDVEKVVGGPLELCPECTKLLLHSWVKRQTCPYDPKPACKHCPSHCYHPRYRSQIRQVMRDSGRRLLLRGRLDYLFKLLF